MKAAQLNSLAGPSSFQIVDMPEPIPGEDNILVEIKAASINPFDVKVVSGSYGDMGLKLPATWGGDFSGIVKEASENTGFKIGDEIFGTASVLAGGSGSFGEVATARLGSVSIKPGNINFEEAAALPLVGSSAVQALEDHIKLQSGNKILIHGGAGGIGHIAIQVAKAIGAYVATTVSSDDVTFVKSMGADEGIDYKTQDFSKILKDYDAVFDTVGESTWEKSFKVLRDGGIFVSMLGEPKSENSSKNITVIGQRSETNSNHLNRIAKYVSDGLVKVNVDKVFPLDQIKEAFVYQESSHPKGKVVIKIH